MSGLQDPAIIPCYQQLKITCSQLLILTKTKKMGKNEKTSPKMATKAAKALANPNSSKLTRSLAGALLTQSPDKKSTKKK